MGATLEVEGLGKKPATIKKRQASTIQDPIKLETLSDKLYGVMDKVLDYAKEVMESKEQIEVSRWTKDGKVEKYKVDKYTPDHKLKVAEIITPKVFADKKDVSTGGDPAKPIPVSFNFVPIQPRKD